MIAVTVFYIKHSDTVCAGQQQFLQYYMRHLRLLISLLCPLEDALDPGPRGPRGYNTFFMLNSAEHEIFSANKYENSNKSWHFHIY